MKKLSGTTVQKGIALGPVLVLKKREQTLEKRKAADPESEILRLEKAVDQAALQLQRLYEKAVREAEEASRAIIEGHQMLLEDREYLDTIRRIIRTERVNAEYAVGAAGDTFSGLFARMEDEYMRARAEDVKDISSRLMRSLTGKKETDPASMVPSIIVAEDLTPSETIGMDKEKILGFVTIHGSVNSHTAILAKLRNIPALTGVPLNLDEIHTGMRALVDGFQGEVIFEPSEELCARAVRRMREEKETSLLLQTLKGKETVTSGGKRIRLYANIGSTEDVGAVLENDGEGIGLFRSEFLYLGRNDFPTEEEQFTAYRQVLQAMGDRDVIIRTMDIGADKQAAYFQLGQEHNPAMGYRGIRICLKQPEIFRTQLRALLRAAVFGRLSVMYPMITSVEEVEQILAIVEEVRRKLEKLQVPHQMPKQGIMIETPADL